MVSFKTISINRWLKILTVATFFMGQGVQAGPVTDHGQLSVSGAKIVDENGDIMQLRGMSSHAFTAQYPYKWDPILEKEVFTQGEAAGLYTTKETIQWTRDHWGANAFRVAMYVEGWGVADPRNWQHQDTFYERDTDDSNGNGNTSEIIPKSPTLGNVFYSTEKGYKNEPARLSFKYMQDLYTAIRWAEDLDMYVLVDWHVLEDTPEKYQEQARMFFELVSTEFKESKNIIYELANEPTDTAVEISTAEYDVAHAWEELKVNKDAGNKYYKEKKFAVWESEVAPGKWAVTDIKYLEPRWEERSNEWFTWTQLKAYANDMLPIIRVNSPNALVTMGTPVFDQEINAPIDDRLADPNVAYSLHFYACTHLSNGDGTDSDNTDDFGNTSVFQNAQAAVAANLPVFVSEWGTVKSWGGGNVCEGQTETWIDFLSDNDISWFNWSLTGKDEGASVFTPNIDPEFTKLLGGDGVISDSDDATFSENLTETGKLVKCLMSDCNSILDVLDGAMNLSAFTTIDLATLNAANSDLAGATYTLIDNAGGQAVLNGSTVTFNALASFTGGNFTYQAEVNGVLSNEATVSVNLTDSVTCDWHLDKDTDFYNNHWNGTLLVSNNSASEINEWTIEVTTSTNTRLGSVWWTAPVYSNSTENTDGTVTYSISDQGWDGNIPAGGSRQVVITGHVLSDLQSWESGFNGFDQSGIESFAGDCASTVNGLINYDFNFMAPVTGSTISDSRNYIELHWFNDTDEVPVIRDENDNTFALTPGFYPGPNETWRGVEVATFANKVTGRFDQWAAATGLDMSPGTHSWVLEAGGSISDPFTFTAAITSHEYTCELELVTVGIPDNLYTWIGRLKITNVGSTAVTNWNTEFKWFEIPPTLNANYWILGDNPHFNTFGSPEATRVWQSYPNDPNNDFEEAKAFVTPTGTVNIAPGASESYLVSAAGLRATPRMYCGGLND